MKALSDGLKKGPGLEGKIGVEDDVWPSLEEDAGGSREQIFLACF